LCLRDRRQREAEAAVNKHFEESMEMARRHPLQAQFLLNQVSFHVKCSGKSCSSNFQSQLESRDCF
jgi:hypothetical protein